MKFKLRFICLLFCLSAYAQDSTQQKHGLFKLSGVSIIGAFASYSNSTNNGGNQTYTSKQPLVTMWPAVASKPYYNYPQYTAYNNGNGGMLGAYLTFDNYSKKKKRYAIHSQTKVGISLLTYNGLTANFGNTIAKRLDTVSNYISGNNVPFYRDSVTAYGSSIKYNSTNIGLDIQQVFSTNQKKRVSVFAGIGASVNFSVISIIRESFDKERGINSTTNSAFDYQKNGASLQDAKTDFMVGDTYKIKNSILYQLYIPAGITIRFGNNEKSKLSHLYLSPQVRVGYQLIHFSSNSTFAYVICYASLGLSYRF